MILKSPYPQILKTSDWLRRTKEKHGTLAGSVGARVFSVYTHATDVPGLATLFH